MAFKLLPNRGMSSSTTLGIGHDIIPTAVSKGADDLLSNPVFNKIYEKHVPSEIKQMADTLIYGVNGGQGRVVKDINSRKDPQLTFHWSAILPFGFPPSHVEEVSFPSANIEAMPFHRGNKKRYDPGFVDTESINITFYEDNVGTTSKYLFAWKKKVVDSKGHYGKPSEYKKPIVLTYHDSKSNPTIVCRCIDVWPTHISTMPGGSDNDRLRVECSFSIYDTEWAFPGKDSFLTKMGIDLDVGDKTANWAINQLAKQAIKML